MWTSTTKRTPYPLFPKPAIPETPPTIHRGGAVFFGESKKIESQPETPDT